MAQVTTLFRFLILALVAVIAGQVSAGPVTIGSQKCGNCHKAETDVWKKSAHFTSYKKIHKHKTAKKIVKAVKEKRMKKSAICATCHYTTADKKGKVKPVSGPSCESCHGPASEWVAIHNDFGGSGVKREDETADHKSARIAKATAAGMIWPSMLYDVAANCMSCHGLENAKLSGEHASAMLDNGHPFNPGYELVAYSQGSVRHRFYPPKVTENQEMSKAGMSRMYVIGQAAALVSALNALKKTQHAKYVEGQNQRIAKAKAVLAKIPEAAEFLKSPSADAGRKLAEAIAGKDFTSQIGSELPTSFK